MRLAIFAALLSGLTCQRGAPTLRLSGPDVMVRGRATRFQVTVLADDGRASSGAVAVSSEFGSLRSGSTVSLDENGVAGFEFVCDPSDDPDCTRNVVALRAEWRQQAEQRSLRLVDVVPGVERMDAGMTGGGSAGGNAGGSAGGAPTSGRCDAGGVGSLGCDFLVGPLPPPQVNTTGFCHAVILANGGTEAVDLRLEHAGVELRVGDFGRIINSGTGGSPSYTQLAGGSGVSLPRNAVAVVFLTEEPDAGITCPVPAAVRTRTQVSGPAIFPAFRISASGPVAAYDLYPYGGAASHFTSASLLLPTNTWGTTSVAMTPASSLSPSVAPFVQILANEDGTEVRIEAPVAIVAGPGVQGSLPRQIVPRLLQRGQVLQLMQPEELGGSTVRSNKPVVVIGGHSCMQVPLGMGFCDSAHQQLPPSAHLGAEYVAVRPPARTTPEEVAHWRVAGTVTGTVLTYVPAVPNAPTQLTPGQVVEFTATGPFVVRSQDAQHPFMATQLMRGAERIPQNVGDPDFVLLVPPQQFLSSYLIYTDHSYANTHLVFVRRRQQNGQFASVALDCGSPLSWEPVGDPGFEYSIRSWLKTDTSGCTNGIRRATSSEPFGLTVWGTDSAVSYGYPAGMGVDRINGVNPDPLP